MKQRINIYFLFFIIATFISGVVKGAVVERRSITKITQLPEFNDCNISINSWANAGPFFGGPRGAIFKFTLGMNKDEFFEKYEVSGVIFNDMKLNGVSLNYLTDTDGFRFNLEQYEDLNQIYLIIRNKETNKFYIKRLISIVFKVY
ncbi:hypothetical protein PIROE2DRAFT_64451 [Piromyces sp. E2]|nr:hypothetical protein PIROE2DRAFT_64451 [Piromyces sp. E2]|eukprot:OUM58380.1 hypothetical protein PIROE2DRAFT_64451 [Piromyces sp. E2]